MDFPYEELKFREVDGIPDLVLAIAQDAGSGEVLMAAYTNMEGIKKSLETGKVHYYSTSKKKMWLKGETSGHFQKIKEVYVDCDGDAILFKVEQAGGACHEGYRSCFYRKLKGKKLGIVGEKIKYSGLKAGVLLSKSADRGMSNPRPERPRYAADFVIKKRGKA